LSLDPQDRLIYWFVPAAGEGISQARSAACTTPEQSIPRVELPPHRYGTLKCSCAIVAGSSNGRSSGRRCFFGMNPIEVSKNFWRADVHEASVPVFAGHGSPVAVACMDCDAFPQLFLTDAGAVWRIQKIGNRNADAMHVLTFCVSSRPPARICEFQSHCHTTDFPGDLVQNCDDPQPMSRR